MSTGPRREDLVPAAYKAFNDRDSEQALSLLANDVVWPNAIDGGEIRGRYNVLLYWQRLFELVGSSRLEPELLAGTDDPSKLDARVRQLIDRGKGIEEADTLHRWSFDPSGGLINHLEVFEFD